MACVEVNRSCETHLALFADLADLTNDQLHQKISSASGLLQLAVTDTWEYTANRLSKPVAELVPLCEEMIKRYKMQGVSPENRPNGQPTVAEYFYSIKLNYSTVRGWIHRYRTRIANRETEQSDMFKPKKPTREEQLGADIRRVTEWGKQSGDYAEAVRQIEGRLPDDPYYREPGDNEDDPDLITLAKRLCREVEYLYKPNPLPKKLAVIVEKIRACAPSFLK
jgi:hypothetical protein